MLLTVPSEPYGVSGAVVEAAQTERAFFFCPNRQKFVRAHFDAPCRAVCGTYAAVLASRRLHREAFCAACTFVVLILPLRHPVRYFPTIHFSSVCLVLQTNGFFSDALGDARDEFFRLFENIVVFLSVRHIKERHVGVHHLHGKGCRCLQTAGVHRIPELLLPFPDGGAEGHHTIDI